MMYQRSNPEVRAWMQEHPSEVERIEKLYGILGGMSLEGLTELAYELMIDVAKHRAQFRNKLITDIVKTASNKALEIVSGQGIMLFAENPNKQKEE